MAEEPTGAHVMVLNDAPDMLDRFRDLLEVAGYRVTVGSMPPDALERTVAEVRAARPDLLILDVMVGEELLGWRTLHLLRAEATTAALPVLVCTGTVARVAELNDRMGDMVVDVVAKPFDPDALLFEIRRVLHRSKADPGSRNERTHEERETGRHERVRPPLAHHETDEQRREGGGG